MGWLDVTAAGIIRGSFLSSVPSDTVGGVIRDARYCEISAGRVFIDETQPARCGLIVEGLARVYAVRPDASQVTLRRVGPGAAVGIKAVMRHRNALSVQAITDVRFLELHTEGLVSAARESAVLAWAIAEEVDRRLDDTELQLVVNAGGTVIQRIAGSLLDLGIHGKRIEIAISQERLAEAIGASRERVGHELRRLAAAGSIRLARGKIIVLDPARLHSVARHQLTKEPHSRITGS